jgi:hypothetical protein
MAFVGYLELGGNEIINSARVYTYALGLGITAISCTQCDLLPRVLGDEPYTSADMDDAPWFDPAVVASKDFAGVLGLEIVGLDQPFNTREPLPLAGGGAALSPLRRRQREIQVRALLFARSECGLSYGRSWMAAATRGTACGLECVGDDLCFLTCCPTECEDPAPGVEDTCGNKEWRTLFNVGILEGPIVRETTRLNGGWMQQVEFTLTAGNPYIYQLPTLVATGPSAGQVIPGFNSETPMECVEETDCIASATPDPLCQMPLMPMYPLAPNDPCFPKGPFTAYRAVITVPEGLTPNWFENVPLLKVKVGNLAIRRFMIRWYTNRSGVDCFAGLESPIPSERPISPCDSCAELHIPVLPPNSTLTIDGRTERAWVDCPGGPGLATAEPYIYGAGGRAFQWPAFGCGQMMCVEIVAEIGPAGQTPSLAWTIEHVAREDAS